MYLLVQLRIARLLRDLAQKGTLIPAHFLFAYYQIFYLADVIYLPESLKTNHDMIIRIGLPVLADNATLIDIHKAMNLYAYNNPRVIPFISKTGSFGIAMSEFLLYTFSYICLERLPVHIAPVHAAHTHVSLASRTCVVPDRSRSRGCGPASLPNMSSRPESLFPATKPST